MLMIMDADRCDMFATRDPKLHCQSVQNTEAWQEGCRDPRDEETPEDGSEKAEAHYANHDRRNMIPEFQDSLGTK